MIVIKFDENFNRLSKIYYFYTKILSDFRDLG